MKNPLRLRAHAPASTLALALSNALSLAFIFGVMNVAEAQSLPIPSPSEKSVDAPATPTLEAAPTKFSRALNFKSSFEHYKPYSDEKTASWKRANDEVGRIGGWKTYLKEASEPDTAKPASNPHAGHRSQ
jgi:hypothetical protein